jgi:ABC-type molybdate transport system substrate-binding protein
MFTIPDSLNALTAYPIAVVAHSTQPAMAREFIDLVRSPLGQRALESNDLIPALATSP